MIATQYYFVIIFFLTGFFVGCNHADNALSRTRVRTPNGATIEVELALTNNEQRKGLQGREQVPFGTGMLFIFTEKEMRTFWMKDVLVPLDIVWLKDKRIVGIVENAQPPKNEKIPTFISPVPVDAVLEISGEALEQYNLKIGENLQYQVIE
ncbi:MAG: hypothetical protein A3B74_02460 [Candidatus Kerfeldbacteria bacterium RIFCSPHIGHO2_02_FULL_42_14]|uniref:DUF192 domain-containing protein n=1 Tax=Candidatus Kerfeldbacteria bacterium RIFCSPHIGHO2_02_FULL_42_14 TaxID=1798540 RepID=A0A1G2ARV3_9BACT|nr:MAG: hypothetical protein A3B74_02460 [Candidatus Kerfeldbacteria bacterium RIFCSPHIGHO2_02_FULL_42_14]OGY80407.1 MAG: hypothetical protein A3E60_05080 [Candidatus Kerfeldbacteria bacterium RIFCSPHIGHO2_12_FULL_42_13]OGY83836.1 MAG: hypothetical protein A3I91_04605 [Candidatus Kerfeldbacteria bacterium RIFCSPLOWO2_02_FULL_42_19]OGY85319.1 MAG: hypothetical protein A3G01_03350 [Candidatus Kerfeldbacteria bacterium RIFCSPLOWO2_12_FULL_43_9]